MSTIQTLFHQAQLAEAAYANFPAFPNNPKGALEEEGFSSAQADSIVKQWRVVDHIPDTAAGFSATIFERLDAVGNGTGNFSLAIRGSTTANYLADFLADAALIAVDGIAVWQLVDLYNFWQRATTSESLTYQAAQLVLYDSLGNLPPGAIPVGSSPYGIVFGDSSALPDISIRLGSGKIPAGLSTLNVAGHSLGGHLAMAFTRLFPALATDATGINGLGFKPSHPTVVSLFSILGGVGANAFDPDKIQNVYGLAGPEFAAMDYLALRQPGGYDGIFIESGGFGTIGGHSATQMTDSLAVYDLFIRMDNSLADKTVLQALTILNPIFEAGSATATTTLENLARSFRKLLTGANATLATGNRQDLYLAIKDINTQLDSGPQPQRSIVSLAGLSAADLLVAASNPDALATRYALAELNPFAILGDDSLYAKFNTGAKAHELDRYDTATGKGLSDQWIEDRSGLLAAVLERNRLDRNDSVIAGTTAYRDFAAKLNLSPTQLPQVGVIFGTEQKDTLSFTQTRGDKVRLYGGAGNDTLTGNAGPDHLEGGTGDDVLHGGAGDDRYWIGRDGGTDTILDTDGQGRIVLNGAELTGTLTRDATDRSLYHYAAIPELVVRYIGAVGMKGSLVIVDPRGDKARVMVQDWESGELGLTLSDTSAATITRPLTLKGDLLPVDFDITTPEEDLHYDDLGNTIVSLTAAPGRADTLYGSGNSDLIQGKGGDDWISARGGDDRIEGGDGRDVINAGDDNDLLIGNADADDALHGDDSGPLAETGGTEARGDLIDGGKDNDLLTGSVAKDALLGGDDADTLRRSRIVQESRRWRDGAAAANGNAWRNAA